MEQLHGNFVEAKELATNGLDMALACNSAVYALHMHTLMAIADVYWLGTAPKDEQLLVHVEAMQVRRAGPAEGGGGGGHLHFLSYELRS